VLNVLLHFSAKDDQIHKSIEQNQFLVFLVTISILRTFFFYCNEKCVPN